MGSEKKESGSGRMKVFVEERKKVLIDGGGDKTEGGGRLRKNHGLQSMGRINTDRKMLNF